MTTRWRITYEELKSAYAEIEFFPDPEDPNTFKREGDPLIFFHGSHGGEFYWAIVVEDIERTEQLFNTDGVYSKQFMVALQEILEPIKASDDS